MACMDLDSSVFCSHHLPCDPSAEIKLKDCKFDVIFTATYASTLIHYQANRIPIAPPLPGLTRRKIFEKKRLVDCAYAPYEKRQTWERLFDEGYGADVLIITDGKGMLFGHSSILGITSPVLRKLIEQSKTRKGFRCLKLYGMPFEAVRTFLKFLYSSCYDPDLMKKYVLHLLVLSHAYSIPSLKNVCVHQLEKSFLNTENVADVLQLARECNAPRLSLMCSRIIINGFNEVSLSDGWKAMRKANPGLEQELLELLVEEDSKKQQRMKKLEERKTYIHLYEAMEALLHICKDGCRTIGPRDQTPTQCQAACNFPVCKGLESLLRHFAGCKARTSGSCAHCKRVWQLLELHSCMCSERHSCKVPLCRDLKDRVHHQGKKGEQKWRLLARRVMTVKGTLSSISSWRLAAT